MKLQNSKEEREKEEDCDRKMRKEQRGGKGKEINLV